MIEIVLINTFVLGLIAVLLRELLQKDQKGLSLILFPLIFLVYISVLMYAIPKPQTLLDNLFKTSQNTEEVSIDIVDSRTNQDEVQLIVHYKGCVDRLNLKKTDMENIDRLNEFVARIIAMRDATGGCA